MRNVGRNFSSSACSRSSVMPSLSLSSAGGKSQAALQVTRSVHTQKHRPFLMQRWYQVYGHRTRLRPHAKAFFHSCSTQVQDLQRQVFIPKGRFTASLAALRSSFLVTFYRVDGSWRFYSNLEERFNVTLNLTAETVGTFVTIAL
jgi:hypothetical protein